MKPRIEAYRTQLGALKWRCFSPATSFYGNAYFREGCGYTPEAAYQKWLRSR